MHIGVIDAPMHVGAGREDIVIGASGIRYAGLKGQKRSDSYTSNDVSLPFIPQPRSNAKSALASSTSIQSGKKSMVSTKCFISVFHSLLILENRNRKKEGR